MAFITVEPHELPQVTRAPKRAKREVRGERGCDACPLKDTWNHLSTPRMTIEGAPEADILVLGEAPGAEEDQQGRPFVGPAGRLLRRILPHRQMDRMAFTNSVRCRPPNNRTPTLQESYACSVLFEADVVAGNFKAILVLGGAPLRMFFDEATITQVHGLKFPVEVGGKPLWVFPTLHPSFVLRGGDEQSPMLPILENDLRYFFQALDRWQIPVIEHPKPDDVICAYAEEQARAAIAKLVKANRPIGLDIETNGLRPNLIGAEIMTAAASNGEVTVAWPVRHPQRENDWGLPLLLDLASCLPWIAHNAAFELAWLREHAQRNNLAFDPIGFDDSMAAARLYQRRETCLGLGTLTRVYTGTNIKKLSGVNIEKIAEEPLDQVLPYNGLDAWGSWRIFKRLSPHVDARNYRSIIETIESVTEMQLLGLDVDHAVVQQLHDEWDARASTAIEHSRTVHEVKRYVAATGSEFNLGSPSQVGEALVTYGRIELPKNTDGTFKSDDATLTAAASGNPLARDALEFRHAKKMISTYIQPMQAVRGQFVDDRMHPSYSTMLTRTLRLSSEGPNIQNFPKRKDRELRTPIVPPKGCIWASADYSQLEARVYAMASKDQALCDSIISKEDIHSYWLKVILDTYPRYWERLRHMVTPNDTEEQVLKGGRDITKGDLVFASFYGTSSRNVAERTGMPLDIATDILGMFWKRYAGAEKWLRARRREYRDSATTRNLCGVERYGPMSGNEMINTPIQSTAARLVLEAQNEMYRLARECDDRYLMPRINIHDDLTFVLPDNDESIAYIKAISKVLTKVRFDFQIVPLAVEWKIGANWAQLYSVHEHTGEHVR
jgi:uracil-DNA glycosylase family 4